MNTGIMLPNGVPHRGARAIAEWAARAEELGFASLGALDRIVYDSIDPLIALTAAGTVTESVELMTNILIAPLRDTVPLAKQAAGLDLLSGGRLTLGLGVGVREDDFAVAGAEYRDRGARFDRQLADLQRTWAGATGIGPVPARPGGPRLLIGGEARLAGPRAARHGAGWTMMVGSPEQFAAGVEEFRRTFAAAGGTGRPRCTALVYAALGPDAQDLVDDAIGSYYSWLGPDLVGWIAGTCAVGADGLARAVADFAAAGADDLMITPCTADRDQLERLADVALGAVVPA